MKRINQKTKRKYKKGKDPPKVGFYVRTDEEGPMSLDRNIDTK